MLWDMHLCVFDVRLSFENRVYMSKRATNITETFPLLYILFIITCGS